MVIEGTRRFDLKKSWEILLYWRKRKRSTGSLLCFDVWWDLIRELSWHEIPLSNPPWQNIKKLYKVFTSRIICTYWRKILTILGLLPVITPLMIWYRNITHWENDDMLTLHVGRGIAQWDPHIRCMKILGMEEETVETEEDQRRKCDWLLTLSLPDRQWGSCHPSWTASLRWKQSHCSPW